MNGSLVTKVKLSNYPLKYYSVNVTIDEEYLLIPGPKKDPANFIASVDIHILSNYVKKPAPQRQPVTSTTQDTTPSLSSLSADEAEATRWPVSSTSEPLTTMMVLLRPAESNSIDLMGVLIRVALLLLLAALLWKALQCIFCSKSDRRNRGNSSYTINLL